MKKILKNLFNKIFSFFEDLSDKKAVKEADFSKGEDFEMIVKELNIK
ncbi:MAG: hypothetical protein AAB441_05055 [Patescibacteria group bacterium]|mgnify:CR=1 FL=1